MSKFLYMLASALLVITQSSQFITTQAYAVTASDWVAGRIIDDSLFTNANDMSVVDIQNFLNSKVPNCDTWGTQPASEWGRPDLTHAQYAATRGWSAPPYVCLKNYYEVPKTDPGPGIPVNSFQNGGNPPAGSISAAQMIYNAAQRYQINPKVLLVTIHKESIGPLTTDNWPLEKQYTYAMGAYCPDSGPGGSANCDPNYAGFSIQIAQSARLMRYYLDNMQQSWWPYKKPFQTNYILWNVAPSGCEGANVYIENKATAALYTYTPYQPNAAALANMYGVGDGCSAYGNRNFWRIFSDWFGSVRGCDYGLNDVRPQNIAYNKSSRSRLAGNWTGPGAQGFAYVTPDPSGFSVAVMASTPSGLQWRGVWWAQGNKNITQDNTQFIPADADGDGYTDLFYATSSDWDKPGFTMGLMRNTGSGFTYQGTKWASTTLPLSTTRFVPGNWTGPGAQGFAYTTSCGNRGFDVGIMKSAGGNLIWQGTLWNAGTLPYASTAFTPADSNGDRFTDLYYSTPFSGGFATNLQINNSGTTFSWVNANWSTNSLTLNTTNFLP